MKPAEYFRRMADLLEKNEDEPFGGALLAVPPGEGSPVQVVLFDSEQKLAQFWGLVQSRAQIAISEAEQKVGQTRAFGRG